MGKTSRRRQKRMARRGSENSTGSVNSTSSVSSMTRRANQFAEIVMAGSVQAVGGAASGAVGAVGGAVGAVGGAVGVVGGAVGAVGAMAANALPEIFRPHVQPTPPAPTDSLAKYEYNVFSEAVIECLQAEALERRDFLANYEEEEKKLADKLDVCTSKSLKIQVDISDMRGKKRDLERQLIEIDRKIDAKVGELAKNQVTMQTHADDKAALGEKNKIFQDIRDGTANYCQSMTPAQITRFVELVMSTKSKTWGTLLIDDTEHILNMLEKCKYHLNNVCPEPLRTTRKDSDNKESFLAYLKKMAHYVPPPPFPSMDVAAGDITPESLGLPAGVTMQDVLVALHRAQKRRRGEMPPIDEEGVDEDGTGERSSRRPRNV